jgi:hypothetical protein
MPIVPVFPMMTLGFLVADFVYIIGMSILYDCRRLHIHRARTNINRLRLDIDYWRWGGIYLRWVRRADRDGPAHIRLAPSH